MRTLPLCALIVAACGPTAIEEDLEDEVDFHASEGDPDSDALLESGAVGTVGDQVSSGCSTAVVLGLSRQIADEMACMAADAMTRFEEGNGIVFAGSAVLPYLDPDAAANLKKAAVGRTINVTSAFRTVAQQYLLYRWWQAGRCGITAAATPGRSNHESGRAIDVSNYSSLISRLSAYGWKHTVPGDPVHFDHTSSPDMRGLDVHAFQRLWNRNNPGDIIDEDGIYGPATAARLAKSPAKGFAKGACGGEILVDNGDAAAFGSSDGWWSSTTVAGFAGTDYLVANPGAPEWASWRLPLPAAGRYEVFARYTPGGNRTSKATYRVRVSQDAEPVAKIVDQRSGDRVSLGTFDLQPTAWVSVDGTGSDGYVIADSVIVVPR